MYYRYSIFRDIKPENLVLEKDDIESTLKIIDFGTSTIFKPTEKLKELLGTVFYFETVLGSIYCSRSH